MCLICALLATLLQRWARRYLCVTQPPCTPHRSSRLRSFYAEGVGKSHLPWAVEALPALLHCFFLLFLVGLVLFLFNIHHTVFTVVLWWVGLCGSIYICITFMPIFRQDSPYYTPLTLSAWYIVNSFLYILFGFLSWLERFHFYNYDTWRCFDHFKELYLRRLLKGVIKAAEETAQGLVSTIDGRALLWTLESLDEDLDLEHFFAAISGFCASKTVVDPLSAFIKPNDKKILASLIQFMERTIKCISQSPSGKLESPFAEWPSMWRHFPLPDKLLTVFSLGYGTNYYLGRFRTFRKWLGYYQQSTYPFPCEMCGLTRDCIQPRTQ